DEDDLWSMETFEQLQLIYKTLCDKLGAYYLRSGQAVQAIRLMRRALESDPIYSRFHELMLTAYADSGDRSGFIRHYNELIKTYESELGMAPDEPVRQVFRQLSRQLQIT